MPLTRTKVWNDKERLTAADLNAEFNNILDYLNAGLQGTALATSFVAQNAFDMDFNELNNVSQIGNTYFLWPGQDVQSVIDTAEDPTGNSGSRIIMMPGTHDFGSNTITIPADVSVIGWHPDTVTITSTASTVIQVDVDNDDSSNVVGGFNIALDVANNLVVNVDSTGIANVAPNVRIINITMTNTSGATCTGVQGSTDARGVEVTGCNFSNIENGVVLGTDNERWWVHRNRISGNGTGYCVDANAAGKLNRIEHNYMSNSGGTACVRLKQQICPCIGYNYFTGSSTYSVELATNGTGETDQSRGGEIVGNHFDGSGDGGIQLLGARGVLIHGNYCANGYTQYFIVVTGGNSKGNFFGVNDSDRFLWPLAPREEIPFRLVVGSTGVGVSNSYAALIPQYDANPAEMSNAPGAAFHGMTWIRDAQITSGSSTYELNYHTYTNTVVGVAFT